MKRFIAGFLLMALPSFGQVAMMALDDIPGTTEVCVTNWGPFIVTGLSDKATTQFVNQAVAPLSARLDAVDTALDDGTNNWNTAYSWGDHAELYKASDWFPSWAEVTNKPDLSVYQLAAYWPPNATASSWFTYTTNSGAITITGYNIAGGADVVIPDYINGLPVTKINANAFRESYVTSIGGAGNVVTVGNYAFYNCPSLVSVLLPQVQMVGIYAFGNCTSLTSLYFDNNAPTIIGDIFAGITHNQVKIYVTNPTATGWGDGLGGMPVVRLPLYADSLTLGGVTHTNWPSADVSGLAPTNSPTILNPTVHGWLQLPQTTATNLVLRMWTSNNVIYASEVYQ